MSPVVAIVCGVVFALGLGLSGMTNPDKVRGFLDFTGQWDPSLMFVMGGAVATHALTRRLILKRAAPLFASRFEPATGRGIDSRLLLGAAVFGVGWGLAGYCPGPAFVSAASGSLQAVVFTAAMTAGMWVHRFLHARQLTQSAPGCEAPSVPVAQTQTEG